MRAAATTRGLLLFGHCVAALLTHQRLLAGVLSQVCDDLPARLVSHAARRAALARTMAHHGAVPALIQMGLDPLPERAARPKGLNAVAR
jgi:hypothetical protein